MHSSWQRAFSLNGWCLGMIFFSSLSLRIGCNKACQYTLPVLWPCFPIKSPFLYLLNQSSVCLTEDGGTISEKSLLSSGSQRFLSFPAPWALLLKAQATWSGQWRAVEADPTGLLVDHGGAALLCRCILHKFPNSQSREEKWNCFQLPSSGAVSYVMQRTRSQSHIAHKEQILCRPGPGRV